VRCGGASDRRAEPQSALPGPNATVGDRVSATLTLPALYEEREKLAAAREVRLRRIAEVHGRVRTSSIAIMALAAAVVVLLAMQASAVAALVAALCLSAAALAARTRLPDVLASATASHRRELDDIDSRLRLLDGKIALAQRTVNS
jgi:hypothetical protein